VLLAKKETVLQGITDRLSEAGRCYGTEINVEKKTMAMRVSTQPFPVQIDLKQLENTDTSTI
jgi:hypothetical protein